MPCGGIYKVKLDGKLLPGLQPTCFVCKGVPPEIGEPVYFCDEWDCWIHKRCIHRFLETAEGQIVLHHGHAIRIGEEGTQGEAHRDV